MRKLEICSLISFKIEVPNEVVEDFENCNFDKVYIEDTELYQYINEYYKEKGLVVDGTVGVFDEEADECLYEN